MGSFEKKVKKVKDSLLRKPTYDNLLGPHLARHPHGADEIVALAKHYNEMFGLPENLVPAAAKAESNFDYLAKSNTGPLGLMQMGRGARQDVGVKNPFNPEANLMGGAAYYRLMSDVGDGRTKPKNNKELSAMYTEGPGAGGKMIRGEIPYNEQARNHYVKLKDAMERFGLADHLIAMAGEPAKGHPMEIDIIGGNGTYSNESFGQILKELGMNDTSELTTKDYMELPHEAQVILDRFKRLYGKEDDKPSKVELPVKFDNINDMLEQVYKYNLEQEDYLPVNRWR
jgi:hypothetical protein